MCTTDGHWVGLFCMLPTACAGHGCSNSDIVSYNQSEKSWGCLEPRDVYLACPGWYIEWVLAIFYPVYIVVRWVFRNSFPLYNSLANSHSAVSERGYVLGTKAVIPGVLAFLRVWGKDLTLKLCCSLTRRSAFSLQLSGNVSRSSGLAVTRNQTGFWNLSSTPVLAISSLTLSFRVPTLVILLLDTPLCDPRFSHLWRQHQVSQGVSWASIYDS